MCCIAVRVTHAADTPGSLPTNPSHAPLNPDVEMNSYKEDGHTTRGSAGYPQKYVILMNKVTT